MALSGAFFMALYLISGRKLRLKIPASVYIFIVFGTCWVAFGIGMVVTSTPFVYAGKDYMWLLVMTIVCQIGAHGVFNWCLGYVSPLYVSTFETCETLVAVILAGIIFLEFPTAWQLIGGAIAVCGLLIYRDFVFRQNKTQKGLQKTGITENKKTFINSDFFLYKYTKRAHFPV